MNREQLRNYKKELQKRGFDKKDLEEFIKLVKLINKTQPIPEGAKVKLNISSIRSHPDYPNFRNEFKQWVEDHKDDIMTVEYPNKKNKKPSVVCLAEDTTDPKWLFWVGDLTVIKEKS